MPSERTVSQPRVAQRGGEHRGAVGADVGDAAQVRQRGQSDDERRQSDAGDQDAVHGADHHPCQQRAGDGQHGGHSGHREGNGDERGDADRRADRKVDARRDDDERQSGPEDRSDGDLSRDVEQVLRGREVGRDDGEQDDKGDECARDTEPVDQHTHAVADAT